VKKQISFMKKLRLSIKWLMNEKTHTLISTCSICDSSKVKRINSQHEENDGSIIYNAEYECVECEATATCKEIWSKRSERI
jgi:hypothetical protein